MGQSDQVSPSEFTGWWLRLRRQALGMDRAFLARRAAARGAERVTKSLLADLELGRRHPNLRTLPQLALALEIPGEILAALILASEAIASDLEPELLDDAVVSGTVPLARRAEGALLSARFGRAFALAERAAVERGELESSRAARLTAASAALGLGAPVLACWRARPLYEEGPDAASRAAAALIFARAARMRGQPRLTRAWLDHAKNVSTPLDVAWRGLLEGRLARDSRRLERARRELLQAHETALLAGSAWLAAEAARDLAEAFETMKRPDLARKWRHRHAPPGLETDARSSQRGRKTFG